LHRQATDLVVKKAVVERGGLLTAVAFVHSKGQSSAGRQCSGGVKHQKENMLQNDDDEMISSHALRTANSKYNKDPFAHCELQMGKQRQQKTLCISIKLERNDGGMLHT
jgi:hypothetical protein